MEKLIDKFKPDVSVAEDFVFSIHRLLEEERNLANPYLAKNIHRIARKYLNHSDLYKEEKYKANNLLLELNNVWNNLIKKNDNPLYMAAKLAVVGNIIDYGAHSIDGDIIVQIHSYIEKDLVIDETPELFTQIKNARSIVYLGDNAGEIVFDKLFIETMQHSNVTFVVRGKPVINDVTMDDANQIGMDMVCNVISNGSDAPSTLLELCSKEFIHEFNNADLVISKGQGNFEGLLDTDHNNIFFMLMAKCMPMAEMIGVNKNDMVIAKKAIK